MLDREVIDAVLHALRCRFTQCQTPKCREVYELLRHGTQCQVGVPGGCLLCKKMWLLLYCHALPCQEDDCYVPRCSYFSEIREETKRGCRLRKMVRFIRRLQYGLHQEPDDEITESCRSMQMNNSGFCLYIF